MTDKQYTGDPGDPALYAAIVPRPELASFDLDKLIEINDRPPLSYEQQADYASRWVTLDGTTPLVVNPDDSSWWASHFPDVVDDLGVRQAARDSYRQWKHQQQVDEHLRYMRARDEARRQLETEQKVEDDDSAEDSNTQAVGWAPEDLTDILDGSYEPETPALFPRTDGIALVYRGRVHSFHGESESGKSFIAQSEAARVLNEGGTVVYVDFESDAALVVGGRLLPMGVDREAIRQRFRYLRPHGDYAATPEARKAFAELLSQPAELCVIDGVTEALVTFGRGGRNEDEFADWFSRLPKKIARKTGAAVIVIDHVVKDKERRGRFAIGSQHKMAALDGAGYTVEVRRVLGDGLRGCVELRVGKDRPGQVRRHCGAAQKDRTQLAAWIWIDSTTPGKILVTVDPPGQDDQRDQQDSPDMPPARRNLLRALQAAQGQPRTINQLVDWLVVQGELPLRRETCSRELGALAKDGLADRTQPTRTGEPTLWALAGEQDGGTRRCPSCVGALRDGENFCAACREGLDDEDKAPRTQEELW